MVSRHPYYGTHYNRLFGSAGYFFEIGLGPGQEQGEGLDLAAEYLNKTPNAQLAVVGVQLGESFTRYFQGKTVLMTDEKVDYLVFARNWITRGLYNNTWQPLWDKYSTREPKYVVEFDGVPYVWVYKAGPVIDESSYTHALNAGVGQDLRLLGYNLEPEQAKPGETVELALYWEAIQKPSGDYTVFTHLREPSGELHGQNDSQPQAGMYPTYLWDEGERVEDRHEVVIAEDATAGEYEIALGMYILSTLERLPITDQEGSLAPDRQLLIPGPEIVTTP